MCGIAGILGSVSPGNKALDILAHRGPDDTGSYYEDSIWLGHKRLSILDLSYNGHQPMFSADGRLTIVFNGEIYNHWEIRGQLIAKGYTFRSTSDTETILYGYQEYGTELLKKLNGIFSFAIYDKRTNDVIIARDHFGVKPLYYYEDGGCFMFASELKFFCQFDFFNRDLKKEIFLNYMQLMYSPGEDTLFEHVNKLLPGHYIRFNRSTRSFSITQYFSIDYSVEKQYHGNEDVWKADLNNRLTKAVERQLLSDAPLGFFLSGGLDSSLVVAIAQKLLGGSSNLECFTIDTGDDMRKEGFANDLTYARRLADKLKLKLNVIPSNQGFTENFDKLIWHLDEPQADPAAMHVLNICTAASGSGIKVLLSGTAGDDVFSGYRRHQALAMERFFRLMPRHVLRIISKVAANIGIAEPTVRRLNRLGNASGKSIHQRMVSYHVWMDNNLTNKLIKGMPTGDSLAQKYYLSILEGQPSGVSDLNKMLSLELMGFLPDHNLNYTDKLSMAAGVETRVPFLDTELFHFSTLLPSGLKMRKQTTKYLLRKVAEQYLPSDIIYRPKTGFGAPIRKWVKNDMREFVHERLFDSTALTRDFFDRSAIEHMVSENEKGNIDAAFTILSLVAIESWLRQFYYNNF